MARAERFYAGAPVFSAIEPSADATAPRRARPRFLFVGRLTASKGIVQLLQEFAALSAFDMHAIGDGELRGELQYEGRALRIVVAIDVRAWIARGSRSEGARGFLRLYTPQHHLKGNLAFVESIRLAKGVH